MLLLLLSPANLLEMPPFPKKANASKAKPESSSSSDDEIAPYAMHFGVGGETIMAEGTGTPSPMMMLIMNAVTQKLFQKANNENGFNATNQVEGASGSNGDGYGSSVQQLVQPDSQANADDCDDGTNNDEMEPAVASHVDNNKAIDKTSKKKPGKKKHNNKFQSKKR